MTWGATPNDWKAWQRLDLDADLLPVVMDPTAVISAESSLKQTAKTPSRFNRAGEAVGISKWTGYQATPQEIARWAADSRLGICVIARNVKAIDIDIDDPAAARAVEEFIELGVGRLPARRRGNSGKLLLAFRLALPFPKRFIHTPHGVIELLSEKQQFVAAGTHKSGVRYAWDAGALDDIPTLSMAELDVLWSALADQFGVPGGSMEDRTGTTPVVARSAVDTNDPMVAFLAEREWVTDLSPDGRVDVRCPWESEHTSDTGPSSTSWFPAGVGGFAQGHFRCLHGHCAGRSDGDFLAAVGYVASDFEVVAAPKDAQGQERPPLPAFTRARDGKIESTANNVLMALRREDICGAHLGFDNFKCEIMFGEDGQWRYFRDTDYLRLRDRLEQGSAGFKPIDRNLIKDAVRLVAEEQQFDSAIQWAESLDWDGVYRVDTFFSDYFNVPDTPYTRAVGRYLWSALAGRCIEPGVKADMVPALISAQGTGKTTMVEVLSPLPDAFLEIDMAAKDAELARSMRGKLVCELAELRGLQSKGAEGIKAWLSRKNEEVRRLYEEFYRKQPRRCLNIATGNTEFLDDPTGERRWLPLRVGVVDTAGIAAVRDQLWAEGVALFKAGGVRWKEAQTLAVDHHAEFKVSDEWEDVIADWLARDEMDGTNGVPRGAGLVRVREVAQSAIRVELAGIDKKVEMRVAKVLAKLGYVRDTYWIGGKAQKGWMRPNAQDFADLA